MKLQVKESASLDDQIRILKDRGMHVDEELARQWLRSVSYYRLSGYWYPYRVLPPTADPKNPIRLDQFTQGTTFNEVVLLYEFDRKLRTLVHDGMERIEISLRTRIGEWLTGHGALAYRNSALFRPEFDHDAWLDTANERIDRSTKSSAAISHYAQKYEDFPFWVLAEILDFSDISILFDGLPGAIQEEIASSFGFNVQTDRLNSRQKKGYFGQHPLARWCEQLTVVRNVCAHHGRLFNRHLTPASTNAFRTMPPLASLPKGQSDKLYGALLVMAFMLGEISPGTTWTNKLVALIEESFAELELRTVAEMGFPEAWRENFAAIRGH